MTRTGGRLTAYAPDGVGEVTEGTDLVALVADAFPDLADGDVVVVTSKILSKAEGRTTTGTREDALGGETVRVVAQRGTTSIVVNHLGLTMAAAGIDASNVAPGHLVLLPLDPDGSAGRLRSGLHARTGANVAVVVSDTAGRAWRHGQTDLAIGAAGLLPLESYAGRVDGYGNPLAVTAPAVADEVAALAELVAGKLGGRPLTLVRGLAERVLPPGEDGPGARSLVRDTGSDLFALGTREAVVAALTGAEADAFGDPAAPEDLLAALGRLGVGAVSEEDGVRLVGTTDGGMAARVAALTHAHGWRPTDRPNGPYFQPRTP